MGVLKKLLNSATFSVEKTRNKGINGVENKVSLNLKLQISNAIIS